MEIIEMKQADALQAINRSEIDIQVATAKQYPRDIPKVLNKIATLATLDIETAADCFYALRRNGANGGQVIEGLSVRLAEIIASQWGNMRVMTRIVGDDGKMITAQSVCFDLENNYAVGIEVRRRITDRNGKTYNDDMKVVTGNAASAIAYRNAVLKVVPKAITKRVVQDIKSVAMGQAMDLETSRQNIIAYFGKLSVTQEMLFDYLSITKIEEIDKEMVFELRALATALKEGTTTIQETFIAPMQEKKQAEAAKAKAAEILAKTAAAKARAEKPAVEQPKAEEEAQ